MIKKKRALQLLPMDELRARPCEVDCRPALFHRWIEEDEFLFRADIPNKIGAVKDFERRLHHSGLIPDICSQLEVIRHTLALIEYSDGTVDKVDPLLIRFTDREEAET